MRVRRLWIAVWPVATESRSPCRRDDDLPCRMPRPRLRARQFPSGRVGSLSGPIPAPDLATATSPTTGAVGRPAGHMCSGAVSQVAAVLGERVGEAPLRRLFQTAGLSHYLADGPTALVDEREVAALHRTLRHQLGPACARAVTRAAGRRTAHDLLTQHVPEPLRRLSRHLPCPLVARLLLLTLQRDPWRLAGSGSFVAVYGRPMRLGLTSNPLDPGQRNEVPICDFLTGTFEQLCRSLICPQSTVREIACQAGGAPACIFEMDVRKAA